MDPFPWLATVGSPVQDVSILDPVSPSGFAIRYLFIFVTAVSLAILLVVWAVLFYAIVRFRARPRLESKEPPQVYGSKPIEIAWTTAPTLIVFLLVLVVIRTEYEVRINPRTVPPGSSKPFHVTAIGHQWWWEYVLEEYGDRKPAVITANELHMPTSDATMARPVYLTLQSADVCHSYWVPRLAGKTDLIPGRTNFTWLQTAHPGLYLGQCAEYCGTQHAGMLLRVYVEPEEKFLEWLDHQSKPAVEDPAAAEGKAVFMSLSCINCHRVRGTAAKGTYAPDLTHLMSRDTLASGLYANTPENLRAWVKNPQQMKQGCLMPAFGLSDSQLDLVVQYLLTLR